MRDHFLIIAFLVLLMEAGGCGRPGPALVPLSGRVLVGGRPLQRGMIQFEPESPGGSAVAIILDGRFTATTAGRNGVVPGRYRVRIDARAEPSDETDTLPKPLVDAKYADAATSGLTCEAATGRDNTVEWNVEPAP